MESDMLMDTDMDWGRREMKWLVTLTDRTAEYCGDWKWNPYTPECHLPTAMRLARVTPALRDNDWFPIWVTGLLISLSWQSLAGGDLQKAVRVPWKLVVLPLNSKVGYPASHHCYISLAQPRAIPADMETFNSLENLEDYSIFFPDDDIDPLRDYNFDLELPQLAFSELDFVTASPYNPEANDYCLNLSDISTIAPWDLELCPFDEPSKVAPIESEPAALTPQSPAGSGLVLAESSKEQREQLGDSSHGIQADTDCAIPSRKRKWDDSIIVFPANAEARLIQRRRKAFDASRRREVAMNRMLGACTPCKLRKGSASLSHNQGSRFRGTMTNGCCSSSVALAFLASTASNVQEVRCWHRKFAPGGIL